MGESQQDITEMAKRPQQQNKSHIQKPIQERLLLCKEQDEKNAYLVHFPKGSISQFTDYIPYFLGIYISADVFILFLLLLSTQFEYFSEIKKRHGESDKADKSMHKKIPPQK